MNTVMNANFSSSNRVLVDFVAWPVEGGGDNSGSLFCRTVHIDANNFVAWLFILTLVPAVPMGQNSSQPTGLDDMSDDMSELSCISSPWHAIRY